MTHDYKYQHQVYPIHSEEMLTEGAFKRYAPMPGPQEVYNMALFGLPKIAPLTNEPITVDMAEPYLTSAINEIEMSIGCSISEITTFHSEDMLADSFTNNYMGIRLQSWPATEIIAMTLKYPHATSSAPFQTYNIPAQWIYLRRNKINVVASIGSVTVATDNSAIANAGGVFTYITGFAGRGYQPGVIEVIYKAGFQHDKLPAMVVDLIKTWAAQRFLADMLPILFPNNSVSKTIDGITQSASIQVAQMVQTRIELLEKKKKDLSDALKKQFAKTIKWTILGA